MTRVKQRIKDLLGRIIFASGIGRMLMSRRAVIVAFHRIDDRYPDDPITVSKKDFLSFCDFFARHFDVVPLHTLLERMQNGVGIGGTLAITFDDGYLDNAAFAAPELRLREMPATFFITTDFIGNEESAWWDEMRGIRSEWMSWEDVGSLPLQGMHVAAHTASHPDLASLSEEEIVVELNGATESLEGVLETVQREFAYPFGGPEHISEEARKVLRRLGYTCCLSCYGGTIRQGDDVYRLLRTPINNWFISPFQFGFEVALDRSRRRGAYHG